MRQHVDKDRLLNQFGGAEAFDDNTTKIVNYVYQYQNTKSMTHDRIAELGVAQCNTGAFGDVSCESLPKPYTEAGGGCGESFSARRAKYSVDVFAIHRAEAKERQQAMVEVRNKQAQERQKRYADLESGTQCRQKIQQQISGIESRIRAGADANGHRLELKRLRAERDKCGPYRSEPEIPPQPGGYNRLRKN